MRVCIIGAGKVGFYLARTLLEHGAAVTVIERDPQLAERSANQLDIPVINADGTSLQALVQADLGSCDALVAVCGQDENNLVACQLAKSAFGVRTTAARINNPKNAPVMEQLGVDIVVSGTSMLARELERLVETDGSVREVLSLAGGQASLYEMLLPEQFPLAGQTLAEAQLPHSFTVVSITRGEELIYPHGDTRLLPGDRMVCFSREDVMNELCDVWSMKNRGGSKAEKSSTQTIASLLKHPFAHEE